MDNTEQKIIDLEKRINDLESMMGFHNHGGTRDQRIQFDDLQGTLEIVSAVPTYTPKDIQQQIVIYKNSTTYRLYWHDGVAWRYATGT